MNHNTQVLHRSPESVLAVNKVLKNTYMLLSATLIFSAVAAGISMAVNIGYGAHLFSSIGAIVLLWFVLPRTANSSAGIGVVFAITGLLGFGLGPVLNHYLAMSNGGQLIMTALGGTGAIFLALSAYVLVTRKDFGFLGGMLFVGLVGVLLAAIVNIFLGIPLLALTLAGMIILIMSGFILYETSRIIQGGETNYILATASLYLSIYNIFHSLLMILGVFGGDD